MQANAEVSGLSRAALLCAALAFALYCVTLTPTIGWGDSADLALRMATNEASYFSPGVRNYALYRTIGQVFQAIPIGDAGTRANLMSAFFGAATVGIVAYLSGFLARSRFAAYAAGIALSVSHSFWLMAVMAEVYTFNAALVFGCYLAFAHWWRGAGPAPLVIAAGLAGLSLAHHPTGLLLGASLLPLLCMRWRQISLAMVFSCAAMFLFTSLIYWLRVWDWLAAGQPPLRALGIISPTNFFYDAAPGHELLKFTAYLTYNFLGLGILLALWGEAHTWRTRALEYLPPSIWAGALIASGITASIPDKFNIYVLAYPTVALLLGLGAAKLQQRFLKTRTQALLVLATLALLPPLGYRCVVEASTRLNIDLVGARAVPNRDSTEYFLWPGKRGDDGARRYAAQALESAAPGAILIADYTLYQPLLFMQRAEKLRPDVRLVWAESLFWSGGVLKFLRSIPAHTPVYFASDTPPEYYQLSTLTPHYRLTREGSLVRVKRN